MADIHLTLEDFGWNAVADAHREAQPTLWAMCHDFADLHAEAAERIARPVGPYPSAGEEKMVLLVAHALTVYVAVAGLVARGQFDVALYLFRPLFDAGPLIVETTDSSDEGRLELKATPARIRFIDALRAAGHEKEAAEMEKLLREREYPLMQEMAHLNPVHLGQLVRPTSKGRELTFGPQRDAERFAVMLRGIFRYEARNIAFINHTCHRWLAEGWPERFEAVMLRYASLLFSNETSDEQTG